MTALTLPLLSTLLVATSSTTQAAAPAAIDRARYPRQTTVTVPPELGQSVVRIPVPIDLRSAHDPADGSDLALLDADGQPLAVAVVRGQSPTDRAPVRVSPGDVDNSWIIDPIGRVLDGLEITLPSSEWVIRVSVDRRVGQAWLPWVEPTLLWSVEQGSQELLDLPHRAKLQVEDGRQPLRLRIQRLSGPREASPRVEGLLDVRPSLGPVELTLPVTQSVLEESGWSRVVVELPGRLPIAAVRIETDEAIFERDVDVALIDELDPDRYVSADGTIRRVRVGGASLDQVTLAVTDPPASMLALWVRGDGLAPLDIHDVTLLIEGEELLVSAPGPGPLTLLGGAVPGTTATGDLDLAAPELARMAQASLTAAPVVENPDWVAPELRAGLAEPGTEISLRGMRWQHDVTGPAGLVRIPLTPEVLADARAGLDDLRLVDGAGRQIPYLLRRRPVEDDLGELPFTRQEVGAQSRLHVTLPTSGAHGDGPPLSSVRIRTGAPVFRRTVTLSRPRGGGLEPLRAYRWVGQDRVETLSLDVDAAVGGELVISIDNGDDPPLPIDAVMASVQRWELVTRLPTDGARLVYGDPQRRAPDYDLELLREDLLARSLATATLGERSAYAVPPTSSVDRALVLVGLLALIGGLIVLIVGLIRAVPEPEIAPEPETAPEA